MRQLSKKKNEPTIVKVFRKEYPDNIYLDMYDNGLKIFGKRKPADKKWLSVQMKCYHKIHKKKTLYKKSKVVKGLMKYA